MFPVSKARAITATISCTVVTVLILVITQGQGVCCAGPFIINAALFGFIWYRKWAADQELLALKGDEEFFNHTKIDPPQPILPPMASKGTKGTLFVPDPLDRGHPS